MLLIRQYQIFAFIILVSINLLSQQQGSNFPGGIITGKVIDSSTKHTIEYANVVVFSLKDSAMITGGVTDSSGLFKLSINKYLPISTELSITLKRLIQMFMPV